MSLWQGKRQEARGKSEEGLGDFTFLYTVWFYCVHLLTRNGETTDVNLIEMLCAQLSDAVIQSQRLQQLQTLVDERTEQLQRS
ncbi:hypothetical protein OA07_26960 [Aphanizomenon flos-aquae 2012/KM1/D3]|nr:hypothetical protein [Aphanizomenon flos-aquae]KHG38894.1 hypothetical protein OA07_26960 [Aphanizomenon flos-aquae 2012/KM1/D3]